MIQRDVEILQTRGNIDNFTENSSARGGNTRDN